MKVLFITAEGFDTPNPNNQMAEVMIKEFLKSGYKVHLIQSRKKGINKDIPDSIINLDNFTNDTIQRKIVDKKNFIKRYINDVKYAFSAMKYWIKIKDENIIYLQSNPTIIFSFILLKILKRSPIVYSIYDVFPGHAYDIGVIKSKVVYNILKLLQKPCYRLADAILVLSDDMKNKVVKEGAIPEKVHIVPAWADFSTIKEVPKEANRFIEKYKIDKNKFIIQFAGTIGYIFDYKAVIEVAKRIRSYKDIVIQIVGDGTVKEEFVKKVKKEKLKNIEFYPLQPLNLVSDVYSACDLCIIPLKKGVIGNGVPSKAPILMACKRVILNFVENDSSYSEIFKKNNMGISIDIGNYDEMTKEIINLYENKNKINEMSKNAYKYVLENYSSSNSIKKIIEVFEKVKKKISIGEK